MLEECLKNLCGAINGYEAIGRLEGTENVRVALHGVLEQALKSSRIKDDFEYFWHQGPQCIIVVGKSAKTSTAYEFFYDHWKNTLHFQSFIGNPYNLKNLQDGFLVDFFKVCEDNGFKYEENSFSPSLEKRFPDLYKTFKGNIYRLMRNYFLRITDEDADLANLDLGYFSASWDFQKDVETIFAELSLAVKWFYKFNYHLWKIEDLKKR